MDDNFDMAKVDVRIRIVKYFGAELERNLMIPLQFRSKSKDNLLKYNGLNYQWQ